MIAHTLLTLDTLLEPGIVNKRLRQCGAGIRKYAAGHAQTAGAQDCPARRSCSCPPENAILMPCRIARPVNDTPDHVGVGPRPVQTFRLERERIHLLIPDEAEKGLTDVAAGKIKDGRKAISRLRRIRAARI